MRFHILCLLPMCYLLSTLACQSLDAQSLVVVVQREDGKLMPNANVSLRNAKDRGLRPRTSKGGYYVFEDVPEGFDALQVKASGMQLNGCQWFLSMPDTIRMVMRPGPYYTVQEGSREARLIFDRSRLEVDYADGVVENDLRPYMAELGLACGPHSCTYLRRQDGKPFPMHHCEALAALRKNPAVIWAGVYADHAKRSLHEGVGVVPYHKLSMREQHQFKGIVRVRFNAAALKEEGAFAYWQKLSWVLEQYGFSPAEVPADTPYEALVSEAFGSSGLVVKPTSGLSGPFLIGQIYQLAVHPYVYKLEFEGRISLD
jgi:hypothetical protein